MKQRAASRLAWGIFMLSVTIFLVAAWLSLKAHAGSPERVIEVSWGVSDEQRTVPVPIRIVAIDHKQPRDGRVIEELGSYDPHLADKEGRVKLASSRIKYWMSVGAKPSENVAIFLKKYLAKFEQVEAEAAAAATAAPTAPAEPAPTEATS